MNLWNDIASRLADLDRRGLRRRLDVIESAAAARVVVDGRELVCLASNNYLGLADDPRVKAAAADAVARWGFGAGASRLVSGTARPHVDLERRLADFERAEAALVTSSGWAANACALAATAGEGDLICADKLDHASIIDAARAARATFRTYRHGDTARLVSLLERYRPRHKRCVIVTDGLFSMDGDLAPLAELAEIKKRFDAILIVDEAHATGVLGPTGRGAAEAAAVADDVDVTVGTLSKALGGVGGFVAGPAVLIEAIVNTARPFIYTTALPAAACAAAGAAVAIVDAEPHRRRDCLDNASRLRNALLDAGFDIGASTTQIIPVLAGSEQRAVAMATRCRRAGYLVPAIRPPTVAAGAARLRISVTATHTWDELAALPRVLAGV